MKPQEKATELIDKFGASSIDVLKETIEVWNFKKTLYLEDMSNHEKNTTNYNEAKDGFEISLRTLKYWDKVKTIIKDELNND